MPFTLSHTAAVLPFARPLARWRMLSATLIGSMVPDFGLFLPWPWRPERFETHSALALLTFCLPVGLATYWLFEYLIKTPVFELLPDGAHARWQPFAAPAAIGSVRQWLLAACGVLAGAVSHLVWDGFTHEGARGVRLIPALDDPVIEIGGRYLVGYRLAQDLSSLVGLAVLFGFLVYALRKGPPGPAPPRPLHKAERRAWVLAYLLIALSLAAADYWLMNRGPRHFHSLSTKVDYAAVASLRGLAAALLGVSLALRARLRAG
jgi:Domain of unknown function (DUF4184)